MPPPPNKPSERPTSMPYLHTRIVILLTSFSELPAIRNNNKVAITSHLLTVVGGQLRKACQNKLGYSLTCLSCTEPISIDAEIFCCNAGEPLPLTRISVCSRHALSAWGVSRSNGSSRLQLRQRLHVSYGLSGCLHIPHSSPIIVVQYRGASLDYSAMEALGGHKWVDELTMQYLPVSTNCLFFIVAVIMSKISVSMNRL